MASLNCVLWNCAGILRTSSAKEKIDFLMSCAPKFDILILLETHHTEFEDIQTLLHGYSGNFETLHTGKADGDPYAGILVLVNNQLRVTHQNVVLPGRIINFGVKSGEDNFNISAVYGYTGVKANRENLALMTGLLSERHEMSHFNMVLGDFNFVDDDLDRTNSRKLGMNPTDKILSPVWTEFINKIDISDPFRARNPRKRMFSYIHS